MRERFDIGAIVYGGAFSEIFKEFINGIERRLKHFRKF
jgi:hypothetical protein